jgi:ABC-type polysaccharide/polyol phosphate export permease
MTAETNLYDSSRLAPPAIQEARDLLHYRSLVYQFVRRDLVARYKRSVLGVAWTMLNPLGTMLILSFVFSQVFHTHRAFPAYILTGYMSWIFFSQVTSDSIFNLIAGANLLQRVYVPPTIFAISSIGNGLMNLLLSLAPLLVVLLLLKVPITIAVLFTPVSILFLAMFTLGFGLLISTLAVYFRDIAALYQVLLTAWMYLTPIIYPEEVLPERFRGLIAAFNPMYSLVKLFRTPFYEGRFPTLEEILPAAGFSAAMLLVGWIVFTIRSREFSYRI